MSDRTQHVDEAKVKATLDAQTADVEFDPDKFDPEKPETFPPNYFSGNVRRLEFKDQDPSKTYWWCNDDKGGMTLVLAKRQGWRHTERKDVKLNAAVTPRNNDLGSYIRQIVGTDESGGPMYAYLMEMPKRLWEHLETGPGSRGEYHNQLIEQIHQGTIGEKAGERRYNATRPHPGGASSLPPISTDTRIVKPNR